MKFQQILKRTLQKLRRNFFVGKAFFKGCYHIVYYRLLRRNVRIRFPFKAFAPVKICGPGSVFIDKNCSVHYNVFKGLRIVTFSPHAKVVIGRGCSLGGLTVRCHGTMEIGEESMFANSLVQDSLFMEVEKIRSIIKDNRLRSSNPISIGKNVWLASIWPDVWSLAQGL